MHRRHDWSRVATTLERVHGSLAGCMSIVRAQATASYTCVDARALAHTQPP